MPQYTYRCPSCQHTETRIVHLAERDEQFCTRERVFGGLDPAFSIGADGKPRLDEVSLVPAGTQRDPHALLHGPCQTKLERADIETTANMRQMWRANGSGC